MTHIDLLTKYGACSPGKDFASQYTTLAEAIRNCTDYNWLRWSLRLIADKRVRVGVAAYIVRNTPLADGRTVWDLLADERSRAAIETCERYAAGNATDEELRAAAAAATAADAAYAAYAAAATAADAADAAAAYTAAYAAYAAAATAADAADAADAAAAYTAAYAAAARQWQMDYIKSLDWNTITEVA